MKCIMTSCNNICEEYAFDKVSKYIDKDMKVVCLSDNSLIIVDGNNMEFVGDYYM